MKGNRPNRDFKDGAVSFAEWERERTDREGNVLKDKEGNPIIARTFVPKKTYLDEKEIDEKKKWKTTNSYNLIELAKLVRVANKILDKYNPVTIREIEQEQPTAMQQQNVGEQQHGTAGRLA